MGLDAYVYRNRERLAFDPSVPNVSIDDTTGLISFDDPELYRQFHGHVIAGHCRIGNIAHIDQLRAEIDEIPGCLLPIILEQVLGNGSHCGDFIDLSLLEALQREVDFLFTLTERNRSSSIQEFLSQMSDLIRAAKSENNPIYFG